VAISNINGIKASLILILGMGELNEILWYLSLFSCLQLNEHHGTEPDLIAIEYAAI
jgi:hypothetical protein